MEICTLWGDLKIYFDEFTLIMKFGEFNLKKYKPKCRSIQWFLDLLICTNHTTYRQIYWETNLIKLRRYI